MLKNVLPNRSKGFTLIELLIVIGIISILAGVVLVAVNPAQQFCKANDSERKSELGTILSAIYQFQTSPTARGALPQCLLGLHQEPLLPFLNAIQITAVLEAEMGASKVQYNWVRP
ncbi:type II secretion system protein [Candidatus Peregrinibacteria bacterium]|nr:MAG: type II secretion system protein [Candidatus Peregrinibacteria bacterium]